MIARVAMEHTGRLKRAAYKLAFVLLTLTSQFATNHFLLASDCDCEMQSCARGCEIELWVINSRQAPRCDGLDEGFECITYQRYDSCRKRFCDESRESFLIAQRNIPTLLFAHGNTLDHQAAMKVCWRVYERLQSCGGRKMLVFWSWPAEIFYTQGWIRVLEWWRANIKAKYAFAERQGYYIAKLASQMSLAQPLTISGHSFGGLATCCALHYLAGGSINGYTLPSGMPVERTNLRAAVISGAFDNDFLYPGYRYGQAIQAVERLYLTYNDRDSSLKRWPNLSWRNQQALGFTGICQSRLGDYANKVCQQRLTAEVGRSHYIQTHLASDQLIHSLCDMAFDSAATRSQVQNRAAGAVPEIDFEQIIRIPAATFFPLLAL